MALMRVLLGALVLFSAPAPASRHGCSAREESFVRIGGIEQWLTIAGDNCANPAVLFVHGGPGNPMSPYSKALYGGWERDFTIVQWDQRGAGMTYGRNPASAEAPLSVEQMAADGIAVAEHVRRRLGKRKITLVAGSWGSVPGVHMAKARPDLFEAYVGIGQLVAYPENQLASYSAVLKLARAAGDADTVAKLEAVGAPPWANPRNFGIVRRATRAYEAKTALAAPESWWKPAPAYATPEALADCEAGEEHSYLQFVGMTGKGMLSGVDLHALGTDFALPVYLIQGSEDLVTTPGVARRYFDAIRAPSKRFVLVAKAGHDPNGPSLQALRAVLAEIAAREVTPGPRSPSN